MTLKLLERVKWDKVTKGNSYLYGSTIRLSDDAVEFENLRIASGKPIRKWLSRTNYQKDRFSPTLPILKQGYSYILKTVLETDPEDRTFIQIDFFNRQGEKVNFAILRENEQEFTYPKDAFTYTITLMSGGCQALRFLYLEIYQNHIQIPLKLESSSRKRYTKENLPKDLHFVQPLIQTT